LPDIFITTPLPSGLSGLPTNLDASFFVLLRRSYSNRWRAADKHPVKTVGTPLGRKTPKFAML
jgi:hypothetical protein